MLEFIFTLLVFVVLGGLLVSIFKALDQIATHLRGNPDAIKSVIEHVFLPLNRVQALLGGHVYHAQSLTYAGQLIQCGHCGHPITGELVTKKTKNGERYYTYPAAPITPARITRASACARPISKSRCWPSSTR